MFEIVNNYNQNAVIKVIGVGGGGGNAIISMLKSQIHGADFLIANTDVQALRIYVNKELEVLKNVLEKSYNILAPKGRLVLITYHSLEEKVIKDFIVFTDHNLNTPRKMPIKKDFLTKMFTVIKKIRPSCDEVTSNPRSRSAKINVLEKQ